MLGYLYKDIRINRNILCIMLGLIVFFSVFPIVAANGDEEVGAVTEGVVYYGLYFLINGTVFLTVGMMASVFVQTDERKKWCYYNAAVPNGIRQQVGSCYIIVACSITIALAMTCGANYIIRTFSSVNIPSAGGMMVVFALICLLMRAIELPFFYAFGSKIGSLVKGLLFVVLILIALIYFMFGDLSWLGSRDDFMENFLNWLSGLEIKNLVTGGFIGKLLLGAVPLYALSYFISTKVYLKGVDRLEK
ncbi:ABC-2 transporter permease [Ruminococcus sp. FC2018]|uniref:ABC-2 transporter permease n=1 Tax=Ruminococcus sp. FC2018 TaxID=1410617 RepID=UPI00048F14D9|nr:ABC-2 transporter permease [Ruminococcus sp. FC2018]